MSRRRRWGNALGVRLNCLLLADNSALAVNRVFFCVYTAGVCACGGLLTAAYKCGKIFDTPSGAQDISCAPLGVSKIFPHLYAAVKSPPQAQTPAVYTQKNTLFTASAELSAKSRQLRRTPRAFPHRLRRLTVQNRANPFSAKSQRIFAALILLGTSPGKRMPGSPGPGAKPPAPPAAGSPQYPPPSPGERRHGAGRPPGPAP